MIPIRMGIIGFGKVIQAFLEMLPDRIQYIRKRYQLDLKIVAICDSTEYLLNFEGFDAEELLAHKLAKNVTSESDQSIIGQDIPVIVDAFVQTGCNVVVEALPPSKDEGEPGLTYMTSFLSRGIPVVTVDKSPLVYGFQKLMSLSKRHRVAFRFSGATASALPTTDIASLSLAGTVIYGFEGILNGTTNFLLSEMIRNKSSVAEELAMAVEMKICEPDPSLDIDGWDTAFKTLILARTFIDPSIELGDVEIQGIRDLKYADLEPVINEGNTIKLLGKAGFHDQELRLRVTPSIIPAGHPFHQVDGTSKAISFFTDNMGHLSIIGGASGRREISATILKDVINLFRPPFLF